MERCLSHRSLICSDARVFLFDKLFYKLYVDDYDLGLVWR
jgi:hypothetical protein